MIPTITVPSPHPNIMPFTVAPNPLAISPMWTSASTTKKTPTYLHFAQPLLRARRLPSCVLTTRSMASLRARANFCLQHTLRGAWDFQGYVVSDCDAVRNIFNGHHYRPTQPQASAISVIRGMDNECIDFAKVNDDHDYRPYIEAVQQGYLPESSVDTALIRLLRARIRLGMFDPPATVPYMNIDEKQLDSPAHRELARRMADESMVLLKNDGVLPLKSAKRIAIVGPLADQTAVLLGNYNGSTSHTVTVLEGMKAEFPLANITYVPGTQFLSNQADLVPASVFTTPDGKPGLKAEYSSRPTFDAKPTPLTSLVESSVNLNESHVPEQAKGIDGLSVQWTGISQPHVDRRLSDFRTRRRRLRSAVSRWQGDYDALGQEHYPSPVHLGKRSPVQMRSVTAATQRAQPQRRSFFGLA